jgi:hypothetical protein
MVVAPAVLKTGVLVVDVDHSNGHGSHGGHGGSNVEVRFWLTTDRLHYSNAYFLVVIYSVMIIRILKYMDDIHTRIYAGPTICPAWAQQTAAQKSKKELKIQRRSSKIKEEVQNLLT